MNQPVTCRMTEHPNIQSQEETAALLNACEGRFRQALEGIDLPVMMLDVAGRVRFCNNPLLEICGMSRETILGADWIEQVAPAGEQAERRAALQQVLEGKAVRTVLKSVVISKDGQKRVLSWNTSLIHSAEGQILGIAAIGHDISREADLEAKLVRAQRLDAVGALARGIAHDLNNILGAIIGYTELAQYSLPQTSSVSNCLAQVAKATSRAKTVVQQIMTISRQAETRKIPVEMHKIVQEAAQLIKEVVPSIIEIKTSVDTTSGRIYADPNQIHQVIMNLCTNAIHAVGEEAGVLGIHLSAVNINAEAASRITDLHEGPYLELKVSDTGRGMDAQTRERLLSPHFQAQEEQEGTRLGLAVVHSIVASHNGAIAVESEPGTGSTFCIYIPGYREESGKDLAFEKTELRQGSERILLVDDEPQLLEAVKGLLEMLGYSVAAFSDSKEAVSAFWLRPYDFDLVMTDQTMPKMTGISVAKRIHGIRGEVPVILCTGNTEIVDGEKAKAAGVQQLLTKPLFIKDLSKAIRSALDARDAS